MDVKELIASLAEFDEMEAPNGMNIAEGVEEENEKAENKRKKRIYQKAVEALSELQDFIGEGIDPAQTEADETTQFYNKIQDLIEEIDSMSLAFDESLDEAEIKDQFLGIGKEIKSDLGFGIGVKDNSNGGIYFGGILYNQSPTYKPIDHKASKEELKDVVERIGAVMEESINEMEDKVIGIFNERGFRAEN